MGAASTDSPPGHDSQSPVTTPTHRPFDGDSNNSASEELAVQNNATDAMNEPPLSDDSSTSEREPDMGKPKGFILKLKYKTSNPPGSLSEIVKMDPDSTTDLARESASMEPFRFYRKVTSIKPEPEDTDNITVQDSISNGTHETKEDESSDTTLAQQPLNEHVNESHETNTPKAEIVPEKHAISANNGVSYEPSDATSPAADSKEDHQQPIKVNDGEQDGEQDQTERLLLDTSAAIDKIPASDGDVDMLKDEDMVTDKQQLSTVQSQELGISPSVARSGTEGVSGQVYELNAGSIRPSKDSTSPQPQNGEAVKQTPVAGSLSSFKKLASPHNSKQPVIQNIQSDLEHLQHLERQVAEAKHRMEAAKKSFMENSTRQASQPASRPGHQMSHSYMPPPFADGSLSYQRAPLTAFQPFAHGHNSGPSPYPMASPYTYPEMVSMSSQPGRATSGYSMVAPRDVIKVIAGPSGTRYAKARRQVLDEDDRSEEGEDEGEDSDSDDEPLHTRTQHVSDEEDDGDEEYSDDDEPLRTRVKRHPSFMSQDSVIHVNSSPLGSIRGPHNDKSPSSFIANKETPEPTSSSTHKNPVHKPRPLPHALHPALSSPSSPAKIDWSLPCYELLPQPTIDDVPCAKISLPGLVREELLLSPDHSAQETHLLLHVFLPSQQALRVPDPEPAAALLNFHTIAVMVIECFVQYEIGDELGLGRGHFHSNHDNGGGDTADYERVRDAKDADVDEIFFAVVDRWRAGRESKKESLSLIRGAQEFCDQALDVIYYVKEHGLLRAEVSKGKGRARTEAELVGVSRKGKVVEKGRGKRGTTAKPNQVGARKKVKIEAKVEVKRRARPVVVKKR